VAAGILTKTAFRDLKSRRERKIRMPVDVDIDPDRSI